MFEQLLNRINNVEEDLENLVSSSYLVYDSKFHKGIVRDVNGITNDIIESSIDEFDKILLLSLLNEQHRVAYESMRRVIRERKD